MAIGKDSRLEQGEHCEPYRAPGEPLDLCDSQPTAHTKRQCLLSPIPGHAIRSSVHSPNGFEECQQLNGLIFSQWRKYSLDQAPVRRYTA